MNAPQSLHCTYSHTETSETTDLVARLQRYGWLDYCNAILVGCSSTVLQSVVNAAARLILQIPKFSHVIAAMRDVLHWLPVQQRIAFLQHVQHLDQVLLLHCDVRHNNDHTDTSTTRCLVVSAQLLCKAAASGPVFPIFFFLHKLCVGALDQDPWLQSVAPLSPGLMHSVTLGSQNIWPTRAQIRQYMPDAF